MQLIGCTAALSRFAETRLAARLDPSVDHITRPSLCSAHPDWINERSLRCRVAIIMSWVVAARSTMSNRRVEIGSGAGGLKAEQGMPWLPLPASNRQPAGSQAQPAIQPD